MGRMLKWTGIGLGGVIACAALAAGILYLVTGPEGPPGDSPSAAALDAGAYAVGEAERTFVDTSRPTPSNGDYPGADGRTLLTTIWYPKEEVPGGSPLLIYSHGFMSDRFGGRYLAEALARQGYVVASADFPLSSMNAPGGPNASDVVNQPGDVSFLIDSLLALDGDDKPYPGSIDSSRIGVAGLSLGGLTATLVGYHPRLRDARIRAVVSIAGPAAMFTRRYFLTSQAPFLMVAGTEDAVVDYQTHAAGIPGRAPQAALVTIRGASHTAFVDLAEPAMRFMDHPDSIACDALAAGQGDEAEDPFAGIGDAADGINPAQTRLAICTHALGKALHPGRQQMITQVAVVSFLAAQFADAPAARQAARELLRTALTEDFPEVSVSS
ncbi:MAG TPA: hypothetical protein VIS76_17900 [Pseudomonadales bacterium]